MDTLGAVAGPAVAFGLLAFFQGQYRLVFWLSMIPGVLAVLTIIFFIRESQAWFSRSPSPEKTKT